MSNEYMNLQDFKMAQLDDAYQYEQSKLNPVFINQKIEQIPRGTSQNIQNKIIWGDKKHFYDK
jgi:hypothetical protein